VRSMRRREHARDAADQEQDHAHPQQHPSDQSQEAAPAPGTGGRLNQRPCLSRSGCLGVGHTTTSKTPPSKGLQRRNCAVAALRPPRTPTPRPTRCHRAAAGPLV
jgi:hypothetical protein